MSDEHETWTGWAASYALDALDPDDRAAFERHLADCDECQTEVASYREVAAGLAGLIEQRDPPASLRARILEEAGKTRPIHAAAAVRRETGGRPDAGSVRDAGRAGARRWLVAASVAVAFIAAAAWFVEHNAHVAAARRAETLAADARADAARIAELEAGLAGRDSLLAAVLAPDIETARLTTDGRSPAARVYWSPQQARVVFAAWNLPAAPAGRTYQLWGIATGAAPVSLGTFNTDATGTVRVSLPIDAALRMNIAAVTEEPAGGSPQPTSQPFLVGQIGA